MLEMYKLKPGQKELTEEISDLYTRAFPENERVDFSYFAYDPCELLYFMDAEHLAGFMTTMSFKTITHITYFAIEESDRGKGYGSQALSLVKKRYPDQVLIADLETPEEHAGNESQRLARVHFYEKNDFHKTGVAYRWENEDYQIYSANGTISEEQFRNFWDQMFRKR